MKFMTIVSGLLFACVAGCSGVAEDSQTDGPIGEVAQAAVLTNRAVRFSTSAAPCITDTGGSLLMRGPGPCTQSNKRFTFVGAGPNQYYMKTGPGLSRCAYSITNPVNGDSVKIGPCETGDHFKWIVHSGSFDGLFKLRNGTPGGKCQYDTHPTNPSLLTQVRQGSCDGANTQLFLDD